MLPKPFTFAKNKVILRLRDRVCEDSDELLSSDLLGTQRPRRSGAGFAGDDREESMSAGAESDFTGVYQEKSRPDLPLKGYE